MRYRGFTFLVLAVLIVGALTGCGATREQKDAHDVLPALSAVRLKAGERLTVAATTSLVADVVRQVGGGAVDVRLLVPLGADPHAFTPTPQDAAAVANAHAVFINGAGLETFLEKLLASAGAKTPVIPVSAGIPLLEAGAHEDEDVSEEEHAHEGGDPHTWFAPRNVMLWAQHVAAALSALDPANAALYAQNAAAYTVELEALDAWIRAQVAQIPAGQRQLVTDHTVFTYFAHEYGFEQVGAIFPGYSTLAAPSAQELAQLEDAIRATGARAIFVDRAVNPNLAERLAQDTGLRVVFLYTGSLSASGGPAETYLAFMQYNVTAIVDALR